MPKIVTIEKKCTCPECQNEMDLNNMNCKVNEVVECPKCGMEYSISEINTDELGNTEYTLETVILKK